MAADDALDSKIANLKKRLAELDRERTSVLTAIEQLQPGTKTLSNAEKVALFRSLFRGRDDVFPLRWQNSKTGKTGYAPACHNEWVRGVYEKPRMKCSNCPDQAFVPVAEDVVRSHLQGRTSPIRERPSLSRQASSRGDNSDDSSRSNCP